MRLVGAFLLGIAVLLFSHEKIRKEERSLEILSELSRFIECLRLEISCYLKPISEVPGRFCSDTLSSLGFLSDVGRVGAYEAYLGLEKHFIPTAEESETLRRFFSLVGKGYADDEIKLIDSVRGELSRFIDRRRSEAPKKKKLTLTLSAALAFAIIILLI